jgi:hypothetical protein
MSTFTRLYFADRGSHLADDDDQDVPGGTGFVAPETIPLDPSAARDLYNHIAQLAFLPHASVPAGESMPMCSAIARQDARSEWERDAVR